MDFPFGFFDAFVLGINQIRVDLALMKKNVEQVFQRGISVHQEGNLEEAKKLYRAVLKLQPFHAEATHNLGIIAASKNKISEAIPLFKKALDANPKIEQFWLSYIDALVKEGLFKEADKALIKARNSVVSKKNFNALTVYFQQEVSRNAPSHAKINNLLNFFRSGRYEEAEQLALLITKDFPKDQLAWKVLGAVYKKTGRLDKSLLASRKAVETAPSDAEALTNLGNVLKELDNLGEAETVYNKAIFVQPNYIKAHNNLGVLLQQLGRLDEAAKCYRDTIELDDNYANPHNNLGIVLEKLGKLPEAERSFRRAIELQQNFAEVHSNLAITLQKMGRSKEAEASHRKAIVTDPQYFGAYLNFCEFLEKANRLDDMNLVINDAKEKGYNDNSQLLLYESLFFFRKEKYEKAERLLGRVKEQHLTEERFIAFLRLRAELYQKNRNFKHAFATFEELNSKIKNSADFSQLEANKYFEEQKEKVSQLRDLLGSTSYGKPIKTGWLQPVFLVGFPRSGTTLLDSMLRTHSKIEVLEEKPMILEMRKKIKYSMDISAVEKMPFKTAKLGSDFYFDEMSQHLEKEGCPVVIDKMPLNILEIPIINRVFPKAKFILALRHPLDCILSCWMQNFQNNAAMANFVELDRTVQMYCITMEILNHCQKRYSLDCIVVRYEDVILDYKQEITNILKFLDLEWEDKIASYRQTAKNRTEINTPSHHQVIKPIYNTAHNRWKNYELYLKKYDDPLQKWLHVFGYKDIAQ